MSNDITISRRTMLQRAAAAAVVATALGRAAASAAETSPKTGLGLVSYCVGLRRKRLQASDPQFDLFEPLNLLRHAREVGAGGIHAALGVLSSERAAALRDEAAAHRMYVDAIVQPPQGEADLGRFEAEIATAAAVGALAARTVIMPGRRYEQFQSLAEVREFEERGRRMLELARPVVEKHKVRLAVENHKDQRTEDRVALLKAIGSEYVGACVDTGNSFALLEDPLETVAALAPFAFAVHFKDQAVREYDEGFLLADIPLGQGCFDLKRMVEILRAAKPDVRFSLELITRDPLKVTCLTPRYWSVMPPIAGSDLARTLRHVRTYAAESLPDVGSLSLDEQVRLEDANVAASIRYAGETLRI